MLQLSYPGQLRQPAYSEQVLFQSTGPRCLSDAGEEMHGNRQAHGNHRWHCSQDEGSCLP